MKISISMATYNGERFIGEQLESLATQTRLPDELVVTDDGSTDRTLDIVETFAKSARFPVKISQNSRNLGFRETFYRSAIESHGDWIAFCDQDDVWLPTKLSVIEDVIRRSGRELTLIAHSAEVVDEFLVSSGIRWPNFRARATYRGTRFPVWWNCPGFAMAFRGDLLPIIKAMSLGNLASEGACLSDQSSHDIWSAAVAQVVGDTALLPDKLVLYRRHSHSTSEVARHGGASRDGIRRSYSSFFRVKHALASDHGDLYCRRARVAMLHARLFKEAGQCSGDLRWKQRFFRAERRYMAFSRWMERRGHLRQDKSVVRRLFQLFHLLVGCGYFRFYGVPQMGARLFVREFIVDIFATFKRRDLRTDSR